MRDEAAARETERERRSGVVFGERGRDAVGAEARRGRALVIDEVAESGRRLVKELARAGYSVRVCADARAGLASFLNELPDWIVAHDHGSQAEGIERLRAIREISDVPVVLVGRESPCGDGSRGDLPSPRPAASRRVTAAEVRRNARYELEGELRRQLVECRGNLAEVARRMGKDRSTIRYHLRRFGMLADDPSSPSEQAT
ncbi:hypothetical protein K2X89_09240 [Myxococcota bacterium]|nr:hypothetical protein [Myxococcota bacterium]